MTAFGSHAQQKVSPQRWVCGKTSISIVCFVFACVHVSLLHAQKSRGKIFEKFQPVRELRVDTLKLSQILEKDWEAIPRENYLQWKRKFEKTQNSPVDVSIEKAHYRAEIVGEEISHGTLQLDIHNRTSRPVPLALSPLNLRLAQLKIDSREPVWGSGVDGKTHLLARSGRSVVTGIWQTKGRRLFPDISRKVFRFRFDLPPANSGLISLVLPDGWSMTASSGIVRKKIATGSSKRNEWDVDLGRAAGCEVTVFSPDDSRISRSFFFSETDTTCFFTREGLELRYRVRIASANRSSTGLTFLLPEGLRIASAKLGIDKNLPFEIIENAKPRILKIPIDEEFEGNLEPVTLVGYSEFPTNREWQLPALHMQNAIEKNARVHLVVQKPVVIQNVDDTGYRQTDFTSLDSSRIRYSYEKIMSDAKISLFLTQPKTRSQVDVFSHYEFQSDEIVYESRIRWKTTNGIAFNLSFSLPEIWDVVAVEIHDSLRGFVPANWYFVDDTTKGFRSISIESSRAVTPSVTQLVRLVCRMRISGGKYPDRVIFPVSKNADVLRKIVAVSSNPAFEYFFDEKTTLRKISGEEIPTELSSLPFVRKTISSSGIAGAAFYSWNENIGSEAVNLRRSSSQYRGRADILVKRDIDRIHERCQLYIEPTDGEIGKVLVFTPDNRRRFSWQFHDPQRELPEDIQYSLLDRSSHLGWNLPPSGQLMELRLPRSTSKPFGLIGTTSRTASLTETSSPVFLPSAREFRGTLRLEAKDSLRLQPVTTLLQSYHELDEKIPQNNPDDSFRSVGNWRYSDTSAEFSFNVLNPGQKIPLSATLFLSSQFSRSDAYHVHTAEYLVNSSIFSGAFEFQITEEMELLSVSLNDNPVTYSRNDAKIRLPSLPVNRQNTIRIRYRQLSTNIFWKDSLKVPLPKTSIDLLGMRWRHSFPQGLGLSNLPDSFQFEQQRETIPWIQRFFGPFPVKDSFLSGSTSSTSDGSFGNIDRLESTFSDTRQSILVSAFVPEEIPLTIYSESSRTAVLWLCLFLGAILNFVFGSILSQQRVRLVRIGMAILILSATICLPSDSAGICGSLLLGMVLSLLVRFHSSPDRKKVSENSQEEFASEFSGFRLKTPVRLTSWWIFLVLLSCTLASLGGTAFQDPVGQKTFDNSLDESTVLIPVVDSRGQGKPLDVVYVSQALKKRIAKDLQRTFGQNYFISSADYRCSKGSGLSLKVKANYVVHLGMVARAEIELPFRGIAIEAENSCLVDGKPHSLRRSDSASGYVLDYVAEGDRSSPPDTFPKKKPAAGQQKSNRTNSNEFPEWKRIVVELNFRIPVRTENSFEVVDVAVPPVAQSKWTMDFDSDVAFAELIADEKTMKSVRKMRSMTSLIGRETRINLRWSDRQPLAINSEATTLDVSTVVNVSPNSLQVSNSLEVEKLHKPLKHIVLKIPKQAVLKSIKADFLKTYYTLQSEEKTKLIAVEFQQAISSLDDFVWQYELPLFRKSSEKSENFIPESISANPLMGNYDVRNHVLGLTAGHEYVLVVPGQPPGSWGVLSDEEGLFGKLRFLSPLTPRITYRVANPENVLFELKANKTKQEVVQNQSFRFREPKVLWTLQADVRPSAVRRFAYSLNIDPRIVIESVSVSKDSVERLHRWDRHGNRLNLILKDSVSTPLQIEIHGTMPLILDEQFRMPKVKWNEMEIFDSTVDFYRSSDLVIDMQKSRLPDLQTGNWNDNSDRAWFHLGAVRNWDKESEIAIVLVPRQSLIRSDIVTFVESKSTSRIGVRTIVRFAGLEKLGNDFEFHVPNLDTTKSSVRSHDTEISTRSSKTGIHIHISKDEIARGIVTVEFLSEIDRANRLEWFVPVLEVEGLRYENRFLAFDSERLRLSRGNKVSIGRASYPRWIGLQGSAIPENLRVLKYSSDRQTVVFQIGESSSQVEPTIESPLSEISCWVASQGEERGSMRIHLATNEAESISIRVPESIRLQTILVNRRQVPISTSDDLVREIPLDSSLDDQLVEIYWDRDRTDRLSLLGHVRREIPFPIGIPIERTLLNVVLPDDRRAFSLHGIRLLDRREQLLNRLEGMVETDKSDLQFSEARRYSMLIEEIESLLPDSTASDKKTESFRQRYMETVSKIDERNRTDSSSSPDLQSKRLLRFDDVFLLKSTSDSSIHARLEKAGEEQFVEFRLWSSSATRTLSFLAFLVVFLPAVYWLAARPWLHRLSVPRYLQTCILGAVALLFWQWDWIGVVLSIAGIVQLALQDKNRRKSRATQVVTQTDYRDSTAPATPS